MSSRERVTILARVERRSLHFFAVNLSAGLFLPLEKLLVVLMNS
jgi:hypothetical protein